MAKQSLPLPEADEQASGQEASSNKTRARTKNETGKINNMLGNVAAGVTHLLPLSAPLVPLVRRGKTKFRGRIACATVIRSIK